MLCFTLHIKSTGNSFFLLSALDKFSTIYLWRGNKVKRRRKYFKRLKCSYTKLFVHTITITVFDVVCTQSLNVDQRRESESFQFCRVILPDHSSTILLCKEGQTLRQALMQLCERRHLSLVANEVFLGGGDKVSLFLWALTCLLHLFCARCPQYWSTLVVTVKVLC